MAFFPLKFTLVVIKLTTRFTEKGFWKKKINKHYKRKDAQSIAEAEKENAHY